MSSRSTPPLPNFLSVEALAAHERGAGGVVVETALGVVTCMWVSITVGWYGVLITQYKEDFVGRAMHGWPKWIIEDVLVNVGALPSSSRCPHDETSVPYAVRIAYHMLDFVIHLFPTPYLLPTYAHLVAKRPVVYALCGFAATRAWCVACSVHDLALDWSRGLRGLRVLRRHNAAPQLFLRDGVFNGIYGLDPPIGNGAIWAAYVGEVGTSCAFVAANVALGPFDAATLRRVGSWFCLGQPPSFVLRVAAASAAIGAAFGAASVAIIFSRVFAANRKKAG